MPELPEGAPLARLTGFPAASGRVDLEVRPGDVILLLGPNGSGKTSLLRALAGLPSALVPDTVAVAGGDPRTISAKVLAAQVGAALQDPRDTLVGLTVAGEFRLRGRPRPAALLALADRDVATLSSGEARRVSLHTADNGTPLLLLDEPTEGLDADRRADLLSLVRAAATRGAVVVADHSGLLSSVASRTLGLGTTADGAFPTLAKPGGPSILTSAATQVKRGGPAVQLPALDLGAGLHAVTGRNGSGKSTLLLHLAGLLDAQGVMVDGRPPQAGTTARLLLPHAGDLFTRDTVAAELAGCDPLGFVAEALLLRHPLSLSAGEAQRVALAKTLGRPAPLYLLDEPEAHLDTDGRTQLGAAIARRVGEGACVLVATHDEPLIAASRSVVRLETS